MTVGDLSAYQINNSGVLNQDFGMFTQPKNLIQTMKNNKKLIWDNFHIVFDRELKAYRITFTWKENAVVNYLEMTALQLNR